VASTPLVGRCANTRDEGTIPKTHLIEDIGKKVALPAANGSAVAEVARIATSSIATTVAAIIISTIAIVALQVDQILMGALQYGV
jgi:hypothetical protein